MSAIRVSLIAIIAIFLLSCSSDPHPTRVVTPPGNNPFASDPLDLGCAKFVLQQDRDNCEKAQIEFQPKPYKKPSGTEFEPSVKKDKSGKIELKDKPSAHPDDSASH